VIAGFYTYIHRRADDGLVFYVGKGRGNRARATRGRNEHWRRTVAKHGLTVEIVGRWAEESDAFDHERELIARYRVDGCPLCNKTDGGEGLSGYRFSEESRAKIRASHVGMKPSPEVCAKISAANKGRKRSDEFRAKVSAGLKGRPVSAETREKIAAAQRGREVSPERRAKIAEALKGRRLSDEEKARRLPLTHSAELRARHSATMKRPWTEARRAAQQKRSGPC
jgi:hypothetical protein